MGELGAVLVQHSRSPVPACSSQQHLETPRNAPFDLEPLASGRIAVPQQAGAGKRFGGGGEENPRRS